MLSELAASTLLHHTNQGPKMGLQRVMICFSRRLELSSGPGMFTWKKEQEEKACINRSNYLKRETVGKAKLPIFHPFAQSHHFSSAVEA